MMWMKLSCVLMYGLALAGWAGLWSGDSATIVQTVTIAILITHAVEVLIAFKTVRNYRGALAMSILMTLLFGLLHLRPLARQNGKAAKLSVAGGNDLK